MTRRIAIVLAATLLAGAGCRKAKPLSQNLNVENKVAVRPIVVYYEAPTLLLTGEKRAVPLPENPAAAISVVVRELIKGSANPSLPRLLPGDTVVRGAFLLPDGNAFVDLGGPTLTAGWGTGSHQELMAVYSVVQTVVANFPEAKRVRILIDGEPAETLAGHVSLAHSLIPMPSLNADGPPLAAPPGPPLPASASPSVATATASKPGTPPLHPAATATNGPSPAPPTRSAPPSPH